MHVPQLRPSVTTSVVLGLTCVAFLLTFTAPHSVVAARSLPVPPADSLLAVVLPDTAVADSTRLTIPVVLDLTAEGGSLGGYQGRLAVNSPVLSLVEVTAGEFTGTVELNTDSMSFGVVSFAAVNPDTLANRGVVTILALTVDVRGQGGAKGVVDLALTEIVTAGDFRDLTARVVVQGGTILVDPGPITLTMRPDSTELAVGGILALDVWMMLGTTLSEPGAVEGTLSFDPAALRVDSVTTELLGGVLSANLDIQADSGHVRWAVITGTPPPTDSVVLATYFLRSLAGEGTAYDVTLTLEEFVNGQNLASLLPFVVLPASARIVVGQPAQGIWGDADFTWRDDPEQRAVSALDALVCLSKVVGRDVSQYDTTSCDVAPDDGLQYDGTITALDALVILTYVVGRDTSQFRVGQPR